MCLPRTGTCAYIAWQYPGGITSDSLTAIGGTVQYWLYYRLAAQYRLYYRLAMQCWLYYRLAMQCWLYYRLAMQCWLYYRLAMQCWLMLDIIVSRGIPARVRVDTKVVAS
jgi:hypothetical protein